MFRYLIFLLCSSPVLLSAQLYDYQWVLGIGPNEPVDKEGGTLLDFHNDPVSISYRPLEPGGRADAFTNICNAEGVLQLYTNNCSIINNQDIIIQNGNGLNAPGYESQFNCDNSPSGHGYNTRSPFFLPWPGSPDKYVLFQLRYDFPTTPYYFYHVESLLYTVISSSAASGQGAIVQKNVLLAKDTLCDMLAAVRHGNGRDWWVVCPQFNSDQSFVCLLTPDGVQGPYLHNTPLKWGGELDNFWWEQAVFSPNGYRYARANNRNDIQVFDFERCTGEFSKPLQLTLPYEAEYTTGLAISQNSRFVYMTTGLKIYQFDLESNDPQNSRILVAEYDPTDPMSTPFNAMQLAPDGKIYVTNPNGMYLLTVINNPDAPGLACNLVQHGVELPSKIGVWVPNFPNFRLYDLQDSPCDTLISSMVHINNNLYVTLSVAPNPARDFVKIGYISEQAGLLQIFDATGRQTWSQSTEKGSQACQVNINKWPAGFYQVALHSEQDRLVARQRFIVIR